MLRVFLFGAPRVELNGQAVLLRRTKALALLAYLATRRQPHDREALLALLWPEFDAASARNNLRRELSVLKTVLGEEVLIADRLQVAWHDQVAVWVDVAVFQAQLAISKQHAHATSELCAECAAALTTVAQLSTDDFLAGFGLPDCPAFDEWQFFEREELRQQLAATLQSLIGWHRAEGQYDPALVYARRWLALDRLHEPAQRELMRLYAWAGQHSAALRQYEACVRALNDELGAEPEAETRELYAAIKARLVTPPMQDRKTVLPRAPIPVLQTATNPAAQQSARLPLPRHTLPPQPTPFLGREQELTAIERLLADQAVRLITICGPGGIGKTRLAIEFASSPRNAFADRVVFVALQPIGSSDVLVSAIADALACQLSGSQPLRLQLLNYLHNQELLLLLDNFEHLLEDVELLSELLAAAPGVRLLVTSREALNLQEEWLYPLQGLPFPPAGESDQIERYTAVQFFVDRARRVHPLFSLQTEQAGVAQICRLVEGMPLALELAAVWTKTLPCQAVAGEIERNLAFLTTRLRNVPKRHRSMRATFDYSWALLSEEEQAVFMRLSVFRGGFLSEAAMQVAGTTLPILTALVDKSLLRTEAGGRYGVHELLRQYADEQLGQVSAEAARVRQAHSVYYLGFLAQRTEAMAHSQQREATAEIAVEFENIRLAWRQAVEAADIEGIRNAATPFGNVCLYRGFYQEGIAALEQAVRSLQGIAPTPLGDATLAHTLNELAWQYIRVDQMAAAQAVLEQSLQIYERLDEPPPAGRASDPLAGLAYVALIEGQHAEAVRLAQQFLGRSEVRGYLQSISFAWFVLAYAARAQGLKAKARHAAEQAETAARLAQDRWFLGYVLNELGQVAVAEERYRDAWQHYQISYAIREEFEDAEGMALALILQAKVALLQQEYAAARPLYLRGLAIFPNTGDRGSIASALHGLGMIAYAEGDDRTAAQFFHDALGLARDIQQVPLMLALLTSASELFLRSGRPKRARELLVLVLRHPATDHESVARAQQLLVQHEHELVPDMDDAVMQCDRAADFDAVVSRLLLELEGSQVLW